MRRAFGWRRRDLAANAASAVSAANFSIVAGVPTIFVTAPSIGQVWAVGMTKTITWNHNLGSNSFVEI